MFRLTHTKRCTTLPRAHRENMYCVVYHLYYVAVKVDLKLSAANKTPQLNLLSEK